jgi:flagellar protein FlaG
MNVSAISATPNTISWQIDDSTSGKISLEIKKPVPAQDTKPQENPQERPVSKEEIAKAVEEVNKTLALHNTRLEFSIHDKTKEIMVRVVDEKTGETIREVPSKKVLDMVAMTWDELGLLVDEKR